MTPSIKCPSILGCPQRLQQIASNLIDNAIKFSEPGHRVQVALIHEPDTLVLKVHDEGVVLAPAHLPLIVERFGQANGSITRRHGRLGLGLYLVRNLVELHGGTITVESMGLGLGSTFTVRIPLTTAAARIRESPAPTSSVPIPVTLIGRKVLVVDDDPESREVLAVVLIRCGASLTLAGSGAGARGGRFGDHAHVFLLIQQQLEPAAQDRVIVDEHDADHDFARGRGKRTVSWVPCGSIVWSS